MPLFYVGQPVICIRGEPLRSVTRRYPGLTWPRTGGRYTIRGNIDTPKATFVLLREISNRQIEWPHGLIAEAGFWEERFRAASETDIGDLEAQRRMIEKFMGNDGPVVVPKRKRQKEDA